MGPEVPPPTRCGLCRVFSCHPPSCLLIDCNPRQADFSSGCSQLIPFIRRSQKNCSSFPFPYCLRPIRVAFSRLCVCSPTRFPPCKQRPKRLYERKPIPPLPSPIQARTIQPLSTNTNSPRDPNTFLDPCSRSPVSIPFNVLLRKASTFLLSCSFVGDVELSPFRVKPRWWSPCPFFASYGPQTYILLFILGEQAAKGLFLRRSRSLRK